MGKRMSTVIEQEVEGIRQVSTLLAIASDDLSVLFDGDAGFSDQEIQARFGATFDELTEIAAQNPSEREAFTAIRSLVVEMKSRGYIDQAMQMAMVLGAVACNHNHMQELANDVGKLVADSGDIHDDDAANQHGHDHDTEEHDPKTCKDCLVGRPCRKKH